MQGAALAALVAGCAGDGAAPAGAPDAAADAPLRDGVSDAPRDDAGLVDDRFTAREWAFVARMSPVPAADPSPTNARADDPRAATLGRRIFSDSGFSRDGSVSCAGCHDPARHYADGRAVAEAQRVPVRGRRNTPSLEYSAFGRWKMWDGAADSLWAQPIMALENPREHAVGRVFVARRVAAVYGADYAAVFGALPDLSRLPPDGRPGDPAWEALAPEDRDGVNRVAANVGKALEAYERTLVPGPTDFDRYVAGDRDAMTPLARDGLLAFVRVGCAFCHYGPLFTDNLAHAIRWPGDPVAGPDRGRYDGLTVAGASPFRAQGAYSDAPGAFPPVEAPKPEDLGAFITPSLRGISHTAPYGHAGAVETLEDAVRLDARGGLSADDPGALGVRDRSLFPFDADEATVRAIAAFLRAL